MIVIWNKPNGLTAFTFFPKDTFGDNAPVAPTILAAKLVELQTTGTLPIDWVYAGVISSIEANLQPWADALKWAPDDPNGPLVVDIAAAKEITKNRLRRERQPHLERLDTAYIRLLELNKDTTAVAAEKQRLRDLPDTVDALTSPTPSDLLLLKAELTPGVIPLSFG